MERGPRKGPFSCSVFDVQGSPYHLLVWRVRDLGLLLGLLLGSLCGFCRFTGCHVEIVTTPILPRIDPSPEASAMIGLVRLHTYKAGEFHLFDAPLREARKLKKRLQAEGFVIAHTETV